MNQKFFNLLAFLSLLISLAVAAFTIKESKQKNFQISAPSAVEVQKPSATPAVTEAHADIKNPIEVLNEQLVNVASKVMPEVVTVFIEKVWKERVFDPFSGFDSFFDDFFFGGSRHAPRQPQEREFRSQGLGSGVIISHDGFILTNNHVVADATTISVNLFDRRIRKAKVIGRDPKTDLAVIKIEEKDLPFIQQGDSSRLRVGEIVLAIGSPMSPGLAHTVTQGIVSAVGRSNVGLAEYEDFIQTDAAINPGNSGGALVNIRGELVGINSAIVSQSGGSQGIGFAIPINMAKSVMTSLIKTGKVTRGWIGISTQEITEEIAQAFKLQNRSGVLVSDVARNSPAARAGIQRGDIVTQMNGQDINSSTQFRNRVAESSPGEKITLRFIRQGKEMTRDLTLQELPQSAPKANQERAPEEEEQ